MLKEIEDLRDRLNKELENGGNDSLAYEKTLKISQELDKLIVKFYKEEPNYLHK